MVSAGILSAVISLGVNYGIHVYRTHETKRQINILEEKYSPLFNDCYTKFMIIMNEMKKDKDELI